MSQKLLFVNTTVKDTNVLEAACLPNVSFVLYDEQVDTYASLQQKVADLNVAAISEVGFIFETNAFAPSFKLLGSQAVESKLNNVEMDEPALDSWSEMRDFMNALKTDYAVQVIDFFACDFYRNPDWKYVLNTLEVQVGLHIRASTDATGNMANGGNWIMESDNTNIQSIYFNESIADYRFVFGQTSTHTIIIATDGKIYGCGNNNYGELGNGNGDGIAQSTLVQMTNSTGKTPKSVYTGDSSTIVLMTDGTIYGCGGNNPGVLGNGNSTYTLTLVQMTNSTGKTPKYVSYSNNHTMVLMTDGTIYGCGDNSYGQLGINKTTFPSKNVLTLMPNGTGKTPKYVTGGFGFTMILMTDNTIWGCGKNDSAQLANNTSYYPSTATLLQITNSTGKTPKSISCGFRHCMALMTDNTIYVWGSNGQGALGTGVGSQGIAYSLTLLPNSTGKTPKSISCGDSNTMILMTDGTIYGCGYNSYGQLGIGNTINQPSLVQMTNSTGKTPIYINSSSVHTTVLMTDGTIYGCGNNDNGRLGIGNTISPKLTLTAMTTNGTISGSLLTEQLPNNLVTGSVTISGTAMVGQTLTASNTLADDDGLGAISYQWKSNGTAISGATSSTYVLLAAQLATTITVTASYTDNSGFAESVTSSATSSVQPILPPDAPTSLVATAGNVSGNPAVSVAFTAGANGGSAITNYQYSTNNGTNWIAFSPAVTASPILITKLSTDGTTNLTNDTTYTILLRAVNVAGAGTASSSVLATPSLNTTLITQAMVDVAGNWPMTINGGTLANPKTIAFISNLTINSATKYFIIGSQYVTIDGLNNTVSFSATAYPGLVRNGTSTVAGYSNVTVQNIIIAAGSATIAGAAGWMAQSYFGAGLNSTTTCTNNNIINCVNKAAIAVSGGCGIVGSYAGAKWGNLTISKCMNNGNLSGTAYGIAGAMAGSTFGNILLIYCINTGTITGSASVFTSGFVGDAAGGLDTAVSATGYGSCTVQNCYNTGSCTTGTGIFYGSKAGLNCNGYTAQTCVSTINCYSTGVIATGGGGIYGVNAGFSCTSKQVIQNCYIRSSASYYSSTPVTTYITVTDSTLSASGWTDTTANSTLTGKTDKSVWLDYSSSTTVPYVLASNWVNGLVPSVYATSTLAYNALLAIGYASGDLVNDTNASAIFAALAPSVPNAPTSLVATIGNQQVSIAFTAGASNNAAITNYQYSTNSGSTWTVLSPAVAVSPVVITGLTNGSAYSIMLQAINSVGAGASSSAVSFTPGVAPDAPYGLVATAGNQQVSIAFTAGAANGIAITNYQYSIDNGTNWTTRSPVATTSPLVITGLTNGTAYNIKIRAINAMFNGTASTTIVSTPSTTAGAPTSLVATPGNQQATIAFTAGASNGAIVTNYEYSFDGTAWTAFSPYLGVSPAIISGLTNGNTYNIQLRAVNAAGSGAASSAVSVMPAIAPDAPSALVATASNQQVSIAFTPGADNGIAVTNYEYSTDNGVSWRARSPVATTSPIVLTKLSIDGSTNLVNGTTYYIKLRAINASFNGAETSAITSMPLSTPAAPTGLAATVDNQQTIVSFTAGINNGAAVNNYKYSIDNGSSYAAFSPAVTASPVTITGLTNGTSYNIKLMAVNSVGDGAESAAVAVIPATVPSAPTGVSVAHGNQQVVVSFTAGATNGAAITNYLYSKNSGITWTAFSPAVTSSPITITGLTNGTSYGIQIKARNSVGDGIAADAGAVIPSTIAGAPTNPVTTLGNQQVTVAFTAGANNGAPITNYKYSIDNGSNYTAFSPAVTTSPVTIVGLSNGTAYNIKIRAVNLNGDGAQSVDSAIITTDVPAAPTGLSAVPSGQTATISFTPGSNRGAAITNYKYSLDGGAWIAFPTPIAASPVAVVGLTNGTTYNIKLKAVNAVGDGDESAAVSVTPCLPPSAPAALVATAGAKQVSVAFTPGANNGSAITNYKYSIDGGATYAAFSTPITTSPVLITGLADGTTYSIKLKGINAAGDGYESTAVSAKTYGVPAIPTNVVAVAAYQRADITFTAGVNNGSVITNYQYLLNNTGSWINLSPVDITSPITIPDLTNSTTYGIKIRAINAIGGGVESAEVSITTPSSPTVPSAPTSLLVLAGNQQMTVSFNAGPNNGSAITTYQYSTDNGTTWANRSNSPATTSPIVITTASSNGTTLVNGVPYKIKLRAVNGIGNGAASAAVLAISVSPPAAPTNLYPEPGNGEAIIYFTAGNSNGAIITYYQYSLDNGTTWLSANITSTVNSVTITNLDNGATYNIMLRAISSVGNGDASVASEDIIPMGEVLGAVLDGYIMNGTITIKDLSDNLIAGPIMTDLYGNYSIPVNLTSSVTYIVTCSGGIDIATNLPSLYPLTTIIHDSNASSISQLNTNINPLTTIMANIAKTAIVSGTNATSAIAAVTSTIATALGMDASNVGLDYIASRSVAVGVAAVKIAALTNMIQIATGANADVVSQAVAAAISGSSGLLTVDSTFINSVLSNASASLSATEVTNLTGMASNVTLSMDALANPGSFMSVNESLTSLFTIAVAAQAVVTPTNLQNAGLNASSAVSSAVAAVPADQIGTISTAGLVTANICFARGTKIETDQGIIEIQKINEQNTIDGEQIVMITKTKNMDDYMVVIKKDAFGKNVPNEDTYLTGEHKVLFEGEMVKSKDLLNGNTIVKEQMKSHMVYNVLMKHEGRVIANNMVAESLDPKNPFVELLMSLEHNKASTAETLDPKSPFAKLLSSINLKKRTIADKEEIVVEMNRTMRTAHKNRKM